MSLFKRKPAPKHVPAPPTFIYLRGFWEVWEDGELPRSTTCRRCWRSLGDPEVRRVGDRLEHIDCDPCPHSKVELQEGGGYLCRDWCRQELTVDTDGNFIVALPF